MTRNFLLFVPCLFLLMSPLKGQEITPADTFHIEGSSWNYKLFYHGLRVRVYQDLKPILWEVDDEHVNNSFFKARVLETINIPMSIAGATMLAIPVSVRLAGGPFLRNWFWIGCATFGASLALDFAVDKSMLRAVNRYNYLVGTNTQIGFFAHPAGAGVRIRW